RVAVTPRAWTGANGTTSRWLPWLTPLVSIGAASDRSHWECPDGDCAPTQTIRTSGWEISIANDIAVRRRTVKDPTGNVNGHSIGWGLGFDLPRLGGVHYDEAQQPTIAGSPRLHHRGVTLSADALGLWQRWHGVE